MHSAARGAGDSRIGGIPEWTPFPTAIRRRRANGWTRSTACSQPKDPDRAHFLIEQLIDKARRSGAYLPFSANTAYINTIPVEKQPKLPGDFNIEHRIRSYVRWNAMAMVVRANKNTNVGGHIASFASAAMLYDIGYNHFWHAPSKEHGGDLVFVQGHSATGVYARAFMLGRFTAGADGQLPPGSRRQGRLVVSAPVADARISGNSRRCRWASDR